MANFKTLDKAKAIAAFRSLSTIHRIEPEYTDTSLTAVNIITAEGPVRVAMESYSLKVLVPATTTRYRAIITDSREILPEVTKDFDSERDRTDWVAKFEAADDYSGRFKIALSEFEEAGQ